MRTRSRFVLRCFPGGKLLIPFFLLCFSLLPNYDNAFSFPPLIILTSNNNHRRCSTLRSHHHEYRLVDHVDQLQQPIRPPHLFSLPAPGGDICLVVDENGCYHAVRESFPPLGMPVSESGIVDTEVNVIEDMLFGTRFYLSDGTIRGRLCPGGTAGPLLRLARFLRTITPLSWARQFGRPNGAKASIQNGRPDDTLEVLPVKIHTDGSLIIMLPPAESVDAGSGSTTPGTAAPFSVERCGLAGYDY